MLMVMEKWSIICRYLISDYTGCTTGYDVSEVKYVVDAWTKDKFRENDLKEDTLRYKARLIKIGDLTDNLGMEFNQQSLSQLRIQ